MVVALSLLGAGTAGAFEPDEFQTLMSAIRSKDYAPVETFLASGEASLRQDPDYYVILLNYSLAKGDRRGTVVAAGEPRPGDLALRERDSEKVVGFIGTRGGFDEPLVMDGIARTRAALPAFRERLDIHFGIVAVAERIGRWDVVGDQLVSILETSREIDNRWAWGPINGMNGEPRDFMIENVLVRTHKLFRAEDPVADEALVRASQALIEHYPELVYGYANLGALHLAQGRHEKARHYLERALEVDPEDEIVRGNLRALEKRAN